MRIIADKKIKRLTNINNVDKYLNYFYQLNHLLKLIIKIKTKMKVWTKLIKLKHCAKI